MSFNIKKIFLIGLVLLVTVMNSFAQCGIYDFYSADTVPFCAPDVAKFQVVNMPVGSTYEWDIGYGYAPSNGTPTYFFDTAGAFTIKLRVTLPDNSTCEIIKKNYIITSSSQRPKISIDKPLICSQIDSIAAIIDLSNKSKSRNYFFNGNFIKNAPSPYFINVNDLSVEGSIPLYVEVTDSIGCVSKLLNDTFFSFYKKQAPQLVPGNKNGCTTFRTNVELKIGASQTIDTVLWTFPGGLGSGFRKSIANVSYPNYGVFDVSAIVKTEEGCEYKSTFPRVFSVGIKENIKLVTKQSSKCGNVEYEHTILNSKRPLTWSISPTSYKVLSSGANYRKIVYSNLGSYDLRLQNTHLGCVNDITIKGFVKIDGPLAALDYSHKKSCEAPDTFKYWDISKYPTNGVNSRIWNVYDENMVKLYTSTSDTINIILTAEGSRNIELIVANTNGCTDTVLQASGAKIEPLKIEVELPSGIYCPNEEIKFSVINEPGNPFRPYSYVWTFYDLDNSTILKKSFLKDPSISYVNEGSYGVKILIFNSGGCIDSISYFDTIHVFSPVAELEISDSVICAGESLSFNTPLDDKYTNYTMIWKFTNTTSNKVYYKITFGSSSLTYRFNYPGVYNLNYILNSSTCRIVVDSMAAFTVLGRSIEVIDSGGGECNPGKVKLHAKTTLIQGESNPEDATRLWRGFNNENIPNNNDSIIYVNIEDNKIHTFEYVHVSSNGCRDSIEHSLQLGIDASFSFSRNRPCLFDTIGVLKHRTGVVPQNYSWYSDSAHKVEIIDGNTADPKFRIIATGHIPITTIQSHSSGCSDTVTKVIYIIDRRLELSALDTLLNCAPEIVYFNINSNFAKYMRLDFGDGTSEDVKKGIFSHVYKVNSGPPGFDVKLIGEGIYGCFDTLSLNGYIKLLGPVVDIDIVPNSGCEDLEVLFLNNSKYYSSVLSSFGDGTALDSTEAGFHTYKIFANPVQESFKPFFIVSDGKCETTKYYPEDSVVVFKEPESFFEPNKKIGCNPLTVDFKNLSKYSDDYQWDFDGDGVIDSYDFRPSFIYKIPGYYRPVLISRNFNGCYDTLVYSDSINVLASPIASFLVPSDTFCALDSFSFIENVSSIFKVTNWFWDFGDPNTTDDVSTLKNPKYAYSNPNLNIINLRVIDSRGCSDTTSRSMFIHDTILLDHPEVRYVSIEGEDVYMEWDNLNTNKFDRYAVAEDFSGYKLITYKYDITDSSYLINNVNVHDGKLCFSVSYFDSCNFQSSYDQAHCAPFLNTDSTVGYNQINLKWVKYNGWDEVNGVFYYNIFRSIDGDTFRKIAKVAGNILNYLDDTLCDHNYCYYVEAVHRNGKYKSKSNVSCSRVKVKLPTTSVRLKRATVLGNQSVLVEWEKDRTLPVLGGYVVNKNGNSQYVITLDTFLIDTDVDVELESYTYRIKLKDHCENYSDYSNKGKTILLSGKGGDFSTKMEWTPYEKWNNGVGRYILELENEFGEFKTIVEVNEDILTYTDEEVHLDLGDSFCYRITAIEKINGYDTSVSNVYCLAPNSVLFVPTGFTPNNNDNLNDDFIPYSAFLFDKKGDKLRSYQFSIYNRWGELLFNTDDPARGWDGSFNNKAAPLGTYLYSVKAVGLDGKAHQKNGYVALIR